MAANAKRVTPPVKPDPVRLEPVMLAVSKTRALAWMLDRLGDADSPLTSNMGLALQGAPEDTRGWLQQTVYEALRDELETLERAYRKVGTDGRMVFPSGARPAKQGGA